MRYCAATLSALLLLLTAASAASQGVERTFKVTFVTSDLIYLNGGNADGLSVGTRPSVYRDAQKITELEVLHLAEHSAACRLIDPAATVLIGDLIRISIDVKAAVDSNITKFDSLPELAQPARLQTAEIVGIPDESDIRPEASGSVSVLLSDWDDHGDANLDNSQGRVDLDLRVEPLWTPGLTFSMRTSGRQDHRSSLRAGANDDSWESRIATFALDYRRDESRLSMSMGRINPARVGAIGRLDGASVEYRISIPLKVGVFAGENSQWQYAENHPELQTYGVYVGYRRGSARNILFDQTFAAVGQYHGGTTSRETLLSQGRLTRNGRWNLSHSVELDVNRGWRKRDDTQTIELSTVYSQARVNLTHGVAASLSYDTRKLYRTYETRDIADSIFDDRVRQGVHGQLDMTMPSGVYLSIGAGVRSVDGESSRTVSYNSALRKQGLVNAKSSLNVQGVVFQSDVSHGYNLNASFGQGVRVRDWVSLGAGLYSYTLDGSESARLNRRVDLTIRVGVTQGLAVNALGQLSGGDDTIGHRLEAGLSVQF